MDQEHILQFFEYAHLPVLLQTVSRPFCDLAKDIVETLPPNSERAVALRKLLEAKDAALRAAIAEEPGTVSLRQVAKIARGGNDPIPAHGLRG